MDLFDTKPQVRNARHDSGAGGSMSNQTFDLVVIGSGPAGQKAAIAAAKLRKHVAVVERKQMLGGVSVHTGTIPSKTLREAVLYLTGFRQRSFYGRDYVLKEDISVQDLSFRVQTAIVLVIEFEARRLFSSDLPRFVVSGYPVKSLKFDYVFEKDKKPFMVSAIYHDDRFTYIRSSAEEKPTLYEVKDSSPNLINFDLKEGVYVIPSSSRHTASICSSTSSCRGKPGSFREWWAGIVLSSRNGRT